jgi:uracil-DNA glycosylase
MKKKSKPDLFNPKDYGTCMVVGHKQAAERREIVFVGESVGDPVALVTSRYFVGDKPARQTRALRMADDKTLFKELQKECDAPSKHLV